MEMAQLWVNLPAKDKLSPPHYQPIVAADIPSVPLPADAGQVRVIAGRYDDAHGPAKTFTPVNVWDVRLRSGSSVTLRLPEGHTSLIALLHGALRINGAQDVEAEQIVQFDRAGEDVQLTASADAVFLVLTGEPIAGYGPFVMNTRDEIMTAIRDLQEGRFARLAPA